MVHVQRLISTMIAATCAVTLLNLSSSVMGQEDISHNLIRDPVELGNPYQSTHGRGDNVMKRSKHSNNYRRPTPPLPSSTSFSTSGEVGSTGMGSQLVEGHETGHHDHANPQSEEADCPLCTAARKNARLDEDTLRSVRVEMVKRQILKKLRLKEPPKMGNVPNHHTILPPIAFGHSVSSNAVRNENEEDDVSNIDLEDFYGKTEQIIVLPQDEIGDCARWPNDNRGSRSEASSCFVFNLPKEVGSNQISSAELWVYKLSDVSSEQIESNSSQHDQNKTLHNQHHFSISEILAMPNHRSSRRRSSIHFSPIAFRNDVPESSAWVNFNITERARKWLVTDAPDHTIKISCSTCSQDINELPFDTSGEQLPFIVFNIANGRKKRRGRRSPLNCSPGIQECCRESLYISFAEIKWDWVMEPKGFNAFYCKGKCHGDTALASSDTRHAGLMVDYVRSQGGVNNRTAELIPCCTATEMKPISLLYMDSNTTIQQVILPNMVVKSCGCK